jgi:Na+-driven multidrug efflux pump
VVALDPVIHEQVNSFCRVLLPGLPFRTAFQCLDGWMQSQNIVFPQLCVRFVGVFLNLAFNFVFIYGGVFGFKGVGYLG